MDNNLGNKQIMARNIQKYMELNDKSRQDVCKALGIKYTTFTDWIKGKTYPRIDKIELMARYFGISKSDLVEEDGRSDPSQPPENSELHYYLDDDARELAEFLFEHPEYKVLFDASRKVKKEDIQFIKDMIDRMTGNN